MDSSRFDEFTKALATPASRRQALKTLAATTFGGILALSGIGTAFAKKKCPPGQTNCGGKCVDTTKDPNNCGLCGLVCVSGLCVNSLCCATGANQCGNSCCTQTCCGGSTCVDTNMDVNNCGGCGIVCRSDQICQGGKCVCPTGLTDCHGKCVNTITDPHNCGGCGIVCPKGEICSLGKCVVPSMCASGCFNPCNKQGTCYCNDTTEHVTACVQPVCLTGPCTSSADCPAGSICSTQGCCGPQPFCIPLCAGMASSGVRTYGVPL